MAGHLAADGIQPTYEELKLGGYLRTELIKASIQPTYEELKPLNRGAIIRWKTLYPAYL